MAQSKVKKKKQDARLAGRQAAWEKLSAADKEATTKPGSNRK